MRHTMLVIGGLALVAPTVHAQGRLAVRESPPVAVSALPAGPNANTASASRAITPPVLDGRTNDPAWDTAQVIDQFLQYDPGEGWDRRMERR